MRRIALAIACFALTASAPAFAAPTAPTPARPVTSVRPACRPLPAEAPVRLHFVDAPVDEVLGFFACLTGAQFVTHEDLSSRHVELVADGPVPLSQAWSALLKALHHAGLEVVVDGDQVLVLRIVV